MEQTVYGDILFFVNFCMDFQCLFLTAKLLHRPFSLWRGAIFSALGALYACAALFLSVAGVWAFLADCAVCFLMCTGTFLTKESGFRRLLVPFAFYFGVSFAVGGVMSGIASLLSHIEMPLGSSGGTDVSSVTFFLLAGLGGGATFIWGRFCQRRAKGRCADLTLSLEGNILPVHCMVDTANLLRDPVSGRPVVLLDLDAANGFLPDELLAVAEAGNAAGMAALPHNIACRVRLIPATTATGKGLLFAMAPDSALLDAGRGEREVELLVAPVALSADTKEFGGLLPAELITE
ncbi:MAG: sigma-E processing peptidase SpoIIGA [Clostridia bacterium]|nr:sigma-E processing peptidase SpoIIGA [Clostridia bacterium]